ncbi:hypothetical protein B566_EDAN003919 [Ephemera danica]|nr:hypothetical protein B566_EDAN003919 [Ephemera danica]
MRFLWIIVLVGLLAASEAKKKIIRNKFDGDFEFAEEIWLTKMPEKENKNKIVGRFIMHLLVVTIWMH